MHADPFNPNANGAVLAMAVQADGKLIVVGAFTAIAGQCRTRLARLNVHGSIDSSFADTVVDGIVRAIAVLDNGRILIGGSFSQVGASACNRLARLRTDGSLDLAFNPDADNSVFALALLPEGKLVAGGWFSIIGGQPRNHIARLSTPQATLLALNILDYSTGASDISWARPGSGSESVLPPQILFLVGGIT